MYPYIIPFSGAAFSRDPSLSPHTRYLHRQVAGTDIAWEQPAKILPIDPVVRDVILRMEHGFETLLAGLEKHVAHLPSRVRSLLWILSAIPILAEFGIAGGAQSVGHGIVVDFDFSIGMGREIWKAG